MNKQEMYRSIPKVDMLLRNEKVEKACSACGRACVMEAVHAETEALRRLIRETEDEAAVQSAVEQLPEKIAARAQAMTEPSIRRVINGTGMILHTNLGRAPSGRALTEKMAEIVSGYCSLEYDLDEGGRGSRTAAAEALLCRMTGAEDALVVNNNAAAVILILSTLAAGGEVIVSRGELVEIGGHFRIPDVMVQSGARLVEVGTSNRTRLEDYEKAVSGDTRVLMKVHTSNYAVLGFTESVPVKALHQLSVRCGVPVVEDLGSGALINPARYGLPDEPTVREMVREGADVLCFSGDKLLGGPQAGLILGKKEYIRRMRENPLMRALRVGKLTAVMLELVLRTYLSEEKAEEEIPVLRMLRADAAQEQARAQSLAAILKKTCPAAEIDTEPCSSGTGGGALPLARIDSWAVVIRPKKMTPQQLEEKMRHFRVPVIGLLRGGAVRLDVRTIEEKDFDLLAVQFGEVLA